MFDALLDRSIVASFDRTGFVRHARGFAAGPWRDLGGTRVLITGGTSGIGLSAARSLSEHGAHCALWGRRQDVGEQAARTVSGSFQSVDLADLDAVRRAAWQVRGPLTGVVLNAGAMPMERMLSPQGHEQMWASQVLGHLVLLRILERRGLLDEDTRVVWVASGGMYLQGLDLSDLTWERGYSRHTAYANAKRAQVLLASELATRWPGVPMASMHPGWVETPAVASSMPMFFRIARPILRSPEQGADTIVWWVATRETPETGRFWFDRAPAPEHLSRRTRRPDAPILLRAILTATDAFLDRPVP